MNFLILRGRGVTLVTLCRIIGHLPDEVLSILQCAFWFASFFILFAKTSIVWNYVLCQSWLSFYLYFITFIFFFHIISSRIRLIFAINLLLLRSHRWPLPVQAWRAFSGWESRGFFVGLRSGSVVVSGFLGSLMFFRGWYSWVPRFFSSEGAGFL